MIRISRLTDYAIVLLAHIGAQPERLHRAAELSASTKLPQPTVSKLLRLLTRKGLLRSHRGAHGGYRLTSRPGDLPLARVVEQLEGPLGLTVCTHEGPRSTCRHELSCPVQGHWQVINRAFLSALGNVTLADIVEGGRMRRQASTPAQTSPAPGQAVVNC
ncbi:MAG: SUF system Fe-S cluster assembly regulator [Candidatus Binatia bacterium]|nr:MAG: SUF system Fe-S cluster assembly regulator [Candidatus Binatia bacterium]